MKHFVEGENRTQRTLFPESLDDYIAEDNPVRVVDVFVDELDLKELGLEGVEPETTGRPSYHPATMLKIYIYFYLNRLQSSRRLERETQRNVELIWLTGKLCPDFKAIADFRRDNGKAIRRVCREFVVLCRNLNLFSDALVAIDGSKFKAVNGRDRNFTKHKLKARMQQLEESIARYLADLDRADRDPSTVTESRVEHLKEKVQTVKAQMRRLKQLGKQMSRTPEEQISLTDPDARSMATSARGSGVVGYNVQTAVDAKHHLVVTHEVTNQGTDRAQLSTMGKQTQEALGQHDITALADRGYYAGPEILKCEQAGINALVPKSHTSNNLAKGQFDKRDFRYDAAADEYRCPANQRAIWRFQTIENGQVIHKYWSSACRRCAINAQCTTGDYRRIGRWEHEAVLDAMQARLAQMPEASRIRRQTAEHVFGTLKSWMGSETVRNFVL
jgi:transposase